MASPQGHAGFFFFEPAWFSVFDNKRQFAVY
jgi:hypothetical protein